MNTIKANARYILKGFRVSARYFSENRELPRCILYKDSQGRRFYVGIEFRQTVIDAGYTIVGHEKKSSLPKEKEIKTMSKQKLITKAIAKKIEKHPYRSQDGKGKEAEVLVRIFGGPFTFYILEGAHEAGEAWDGHTVYGLANMGHGFEHGAFDLNELEQGYRSGRIHLPFERDIYADKTLGECARAYREDIALMESWTR